ncbi:hypothetical protein FRB91_008145 [Serendipita sp. 411]|nr:hypothetical protein FRB91_008145 [Serendipita sp. 411]
MRPLTITGVSNDNFSCVEWTPTRRAPRPFPGAQSFYPKQKSFITRNITFQAKRISRDDSEVDPLLSTMPSHQLPCGATQRLQISIRAPLPAAAASSILLRLVLVLTNRENHMEADDNLWYDDIPAGRSYSRGSSAEKRQYYLRV